MARSGLVKLVCVFLVCSIATATIAEAAIPCSTVLARLSPCIAYVQGGGAVPPSCCDGAKALFAAARANPDLQSVCSCLKNLIPRFNGNPSLVNSIPSKCGFNFPIKYTPSIDCSKVHW
ncbi:non-specific lipid-transfer protein [Acinetobacter baumannii]